MGARARELVSVFRVGWRGVEEGRGEEGKREWCGIGGGGGGGGERKWVLWLCS